MSLIIFTEGSKEKGFGHITRMTGICERLLDKGVKCRIVIDGDDNARKAFPHDHNTYFQWTNNKDAYSLFTRDDYVLVDSYNVTLEYLDAINERCNGLLVIDDNKRLSYRNSIVINPNYFASFIDYPVGDNNVYYLGKDYILLRKEFYPPGERIINRDVKNVLITFGGTDILGYTEKTIGFIKEKYPDVRLDVVVTNAYTNREEIGQCLDSDDTLHNGIGAEVMASLMWKADFAVASCGGTSNELVKMQCPSAQIVVADNQINNMNIMSARGAFMKFEMENLEVISKMFDYEYRLKMLNNMKEFESDKSAFDLIYSIVKGEQ